MKFHDNNQNNTQYVRITYNVGGVGPVGSLFYEHKETHILKQGGTKGSNKYKISV